MNDDHGVIHGWDGFIQHARARFDDVVVSPPQRLRFTTTRSGKPLLIFAWFVSSPYGRPWISLAMHVCPHSLLRKRPALVANRHLPVGAFTLLRDAVLLRQTLPLSHLQPTQVELVLDGLASTMDLLRDAVEHSGIEAKPFSYVFATEDYSAR